jgi:hypothetical protein
MINEKEAKELDRGFEAVLDELLTLITSTSISSEKLFKRIATLQKKARNVCLALHGEVKTDSVRLAMELVLSKADVDELRFNEERVHSVGSVGYTNPGNASWVAGCAPAFRVKGVRLIEGVRA